MLSEPVKMKFIWTLDQKNMIVFALSQAALKALQAAKTPSSLVQQC
jgi:hypothetical protein